MTAASLAESDAASEAALATPWAGSCLRAVETNSRRAMVVIMRLLGKPARNFWSAAILFAGSYSLVAAWNAARSGGVAGLDSAAGLADGAGDCERARGRHRSPKRKGRISPLLPKPAAGRAETGTNVQLT